MAIDNLSNVIEEGWERVFRPLATASGKGIETDDAAFKLMGAFTNGGRDSKSSRSARRWPPGPSCLTVRVMQRRR
ncbi:hypothetical protein C2W62_39610 [Candidatus Entotheonella serta]|nr:hypothetical protein C2W62_39610 [Candidatus Entotheonella serta]